MRHSRSVWPRPGKRLRVTSCYIYIYIHIYIYISCLVCTQSLKKDLFQQLKYTLLTHKALKQTGWVWTQSPHNILFSLHFKTYTAFNGNSGRSRIFQYQGPKGGDNLHRKANDIQSGAHSFFTVSSIALKKATHHWIYVVYCSLLKHIVQ